MYDLKRKNIKFNTIKTKNKDNMKVYFNSSYPLGDKYIDRAEALLYQSNSKEGVVFVHGLGDRNFEYLKYYPKNLSKHGFTTIMPVLPFHGNRKPKNKKAVFLSGTASDIEKRFYQSVSDILACVDYLKKLGIERVHIMGFSFGGMIGTISKALDKRINKGIFVVTGGNFEYITWKSVATKILRVHYEDEGSCSEKRCHILHEDFNKHIEKFNSIEDLYKLPTCFRYDPSLFAKYIDPKEILMFSAIFDPFIPNKSSKHLWNKMNRPKRYKLPSGHLTAHLWFKKFILKSSLNFLRENT